MDDGWKLVESLPRTGCRVEPETFRVNGNGSPTVELVMGNGRYANCNWNGHALAPVNWNVHWDEPDEPSATGRTLFSWAQFMAEEPTKPRGRGRKPQPAAASLFEWALTLEQERGEEPVGAGR